MAEAERVSYDIIVSALEGDKEALEYVIAFYIQRIRAVIREIAPWLSEESQEDCTQEVCIQLLDVINKEAFTI